MFVGLLGLATWYAIKTMTRVRQVYAVPETWLHIKTRHGLDHDVRRARELLSLVLQNPEYVTDSNKPTSLRFVGQYDADRMLIVSLKVLQNEIWLETMHTRSNYRFYSDLRVRKVLYSKRK